MSNRNCNSRFKGYTVYRHTLCAIRIYELLTYLRLKGQFGLPGSSSLSRRQLSAAVCFFFG